MNYDAYRDLDGLGLAELVSSGEASALQLLELAIARANAVDGRINSISLRIDDRARARASESLSGPFAGVPFLLKDLFQNLEGVPTSAGSVSMKGRPATVTDTVVERWLDAGLVIFGKTNSPEFGSKGVTEPVAFGPTRNPWNIDHTPGGSSGGSAAAVAAGIVPVAGASDGGGSIRIPAGCTGLFGFKAGRGLVPSGPSATDPLGGLATQGVLSRSVRDSAAMLDVIAGPEAVSAFSPAMPDGPYLDEVGQDPPALRIGWTTRSNIRETVHPEAARAVDHATALLADLGHAVEEVEPSYDDRALAKDFLTIWFAHQARMIAVIKEETGASDDQFEVESRVMAALGRHLSGFDVESAYDRRIDYIASLAELHAEHDVIVTPTLGEPPVRIGALALPRVLEKASRLLLATRVMGLARYTGIIDQSVDNNLGWVPYTQLANFTGRPAMSVPLHWTESGLPLGVQFIGALGSEPTLFRLAGQLERAAPWWDRRPPAFG